MTFLDIWAPVLGLVVVVGCAALLWACLAAAAEADRDVPTRDVSDSENPSPEIGQPNRHKINGLWVVSHGGTQQAGRDHTTPQWVVVRREIPPRARR